MQDMFKVKIIKWFQTSTLNKLAKFKHNKCRLVQDMFKVKIIKWFQTSTLTELVEFKHNWSG